MERRIVVFSDERKKIDGIWDYHCLLLVEEHRLRPLLNQLIIDRRQHNYEGELKFSGINKHGKGTTLEVAQLWLSPVIEEAHSPKWRIYFVVAGIDRSKLDHSLFGDGDSPRGKYATIYNRFYRASLIGALSLFFPTDTVKIVDIYHDSEGNLENHSFFVSGDTRPTFGQRSRRYGCARTEIDATYRLPVRIWPPATCTMKK